MFWNWIRLLVLCATVASTAASADEPGPGHLAPCATKIRIGGSVYHEQDPSLSWALLYPTGTHRGGVYRPGMQVDAFWLVAIEPHGILLQAEGQLCAVRLAANVGAPQARKAAKPKRASRWRAPRAAFTPEELARGVQRVQPQSYVVQRAFLREAMSRATRIARSTRTRFVGGRARPKGLQLRSLARDGLLEALGLKRNDVVKALNGFALATPEGMLGARGQVQQAQRLSLSIERGGKPLTLDYKVN